MQLNSPSRNYSQSDDQTVDKQNTTYIKFQEVHLKHILMFMDIHHVCLKRENCMLCLICLLKVFSKHFFLEPGHLRVFFHGVLQRCRPERLGVGTE